MSASDTPVRRRFGPSAIATPANAVTGVRLLLAVPVLWVVQQRGAGWGTFVAWTLLALTDHVDGWLARRDGTTRSGAFLDPLADKVLAMGGFVALGARGDVSWWPVAVIGGRELGVSVFRSYMGRRGVSLPARRLGKWKANLQFAAVAIVLLPPAADLVGLQQAVLWGAVALTLLSAADLVRHTRAAARA
ncbi:MAG: CDP-alcohol phosphatidyltransferase family protein [Acidimicrobiia bacterium]|nr:CDP-alcohol phosphatidyltransferase family protein [Acidimicrobiia bacterium]